MKKEETKKNNKIQNAIYSESGITLIALVITIIVLIILAGISISLVLGQNGLFNRATSATVETQKARFVEDAGFAYSEAYIEKAEKSDSNAITIGDVVSKLMSSYGYTDEQIKTLSSGVTGITLSETNLILKSNETKSVTATVTLDNGTYYVQIQNLYYPIIMSNSEISLGKGIDNLPEGEVDTSTIEATVTSGDNLVDVEVEGSTIKITAKEEQAGDATITVTCGNVTETITVTVKREIKQGDEIPLGPVTVTLNGGTKQLARGWKYFCEEDDKVWLIYSNIMEGTALQIGGYVELNGGNYVNSFQGRNILLDYLNGTGSYVGKWDHIKEGVKNALGEKGINVGENQIEVKGSPNVQLFQKAYNQMYPTEGFDVKYNGSGWLYKIGTTGNFVEKVHINNYSNKTLFFVNDSYFLSDHWGTNNAFLCACTLTRNTWRFRQWSTICRRSPCSFNSKSSI